MGDGKKAIAPCGHPGEHVVGQYVQCPICDATGEDITLEILICPKCGSTDIDYDYTLGTMYLAWHPFTTDLNTRCNPCGHCWVR